MTNPTQSKPTRAALEGLAERVGQATEGTPMLENEIAHMMLASGWHAADCMRQFTRSIDAAMTLVPENWFFGAEIQQNSYPNKPHDWSVWLERNDPIDSVAVLARALPLALCAAALRARASSPC